MSTRRTGTVVLLAAVVLAAAAEREVVHERVRWLGSMREVAVYVPARVAEPAPLLLVLGPAGRSPRYAIDSWRRVAEHEGVIVAASAPGGPQAWRAPRDGPGYLRAVVERLASRYAIDRRRVVLFGDEAGGGFAVAMALMQPRYFAAAGSFRSNLPPGTLAVLGEIERPVPVYLFRGKKDPLVSLDELERTAELLAPKGVAVEVLELTGIGGDFERRGRKVAVEIWSALGRHSLDEPPRYLPSDGE